MRCCHICSSRQGVNESVVSTWWDVNMKMCMLTYMLTICWQVSTWWRVSMNMSYRHTLMRWIRQYALSSWTYITVTLSLTPYILCINLSSHPICSWSSVVDTLLQACWHSLTVWPRLIGSPKLQIIFHKRATKYRSLLRKMTYKDKGSYESWQPCIARRECQCD